MLRAEIRNPFLLSSLGALPLSSGTNLPWEVVMAAVRRGATIIDINIEDNPFGERATHVVREPAARAFPALVDGMLATPA